MSIGVKAFDEQVICECQATRAGEEVKSEFGIVIEQKKQVPEVPLSGTVVSVGENCPAHVHDLIGREVSLPVGQAAGVMMNIPDPAVVFHGAKRERSRILVAFHHKAIRAVYDEVKTETMNGFGSTLTSLKGR